jgi:hypothetical protein
MAKRQQSSRFLLLAIAYGLLAVLSFVLLPVTNGHHWVGHLILGVGWLGLTGLWLWAYRKHRSEEQAKTDEPTRG